MVAVTDLKNKIIIRSDNYFRLAFIVFGPFGLYSMDEGASGVG